MNKKYLFLLLILSIFSYAKDLVKNIGSIKNKPPYVNNQNLIVGTYPNSKITITLNAIDPENQGVYTILKNGNSIGDGITCIVQNAIQIICNVPSITLTKSDKCYVNTVTGKQAISFCKSYDIKYYLKDGGYNGKPPAVSPTYHITLRVSNEVNDSLLKDYRGYANKFKNSFSVSNYNQYSIGNILPDNLKNQYNVALNNNDKSSLLNNKITSNSQATSVLKGAISGANTQYFLDKADSITTGTVVTSAPIYCTIKRAGIFANPAYVCSLDPMLSVSPNLATTYSYIEGDSTSQNSALEQCQNACKEQVECNDVSSNIFYTLIKDKNFITIDMANQNFSNEDYNVTKLKIIKRDSKGNLISSLEIPINDIPLNQFYWIDNGLMETSHTVGPISMECKLRSSLDIKTYTDDSSFYVEPQPSCYIRYKDKEYPAVDDDNLYTFDLLYFQPQYVCPIGDDFLIYHDKNQCNNSCYYSGECYSIKDVANNINEHIVNNCKDVVLTNSEKLSDAVAKGECRLVDEVSLDDGGNIIKYLVKNGAIVDALRDDIGFSEDSSLLKKENAIEMVGSFNDLMKKGKDEGRIGKFEDLDKLVDFDNKIADKNFVPLVSLYKTKDSNVSATITYKINPKIIYDIKDKPYKESNFAMLPIVMLVKKQQYAEKENYLKTYYLLDFDDYNTTLINNSTLKEGGTFTLYLGRIGDNYWSGYCKIYHLTTNFYVNNLKDIKDFTLKRMKFDDYMMIKINGNVVKVGPYGGDRLEIVSGRVKYAKDKYGKCELNTNWDQKLNIDVKPFLKEGLNTVDIYVEVAGDGEGYAEFYADLIDKNAITCANNYCSITSNGINLRVDNNISIPRRIDEFSFLQREAIVKKKDDGAFDSSELLFKLSDGKWGVTPQGVLKYKSLLVDTGLNYITINPDEFLNNSFNSFYFLLPEDKSIVGVTTFKLLKQSYQEYLKNKDKYFEKDRDFNKYSIKMDNSYNFSTSYVSTIYKIANKYNLDGYSVIKVGNKLYLDKNNNGVLDIEDGYPLKVDGWYFNIASKVSDSREWHSDYNPIFKRNITEQDVIGTNWANTSSGDFGGGIYADLKYPVKMKFSFAGDDYHVGIAVYSNKTKVSCYKLNVGNHYNCKRNLPNAGYFIGKTDYISRSNLLNATGNYFVMFYRDGGGAIDSRDFIRVDFETNNVIPPFKWAIPKNPVICPSGFSEENGFCYKDITSVASTITGLVPIKEVMGNDYDPNTIKIDNKINSWQIRPSDITLSNYVKKVNLWDSLRRGNLLIPNWIGYINFNSFEDGKLFIIFDKKENLNKLVNEINSKGIDYLVNKIENDYVSLKNYLAWDMNKRYSNSIIYEGNHRYSGFKATDVNKFIEYFGMHSYDTLCPEHFYFDGDKCVYNNINAAAFPDYFSNQLINKDGPLYASYDKGDLFIRMLPLEGINTEQTNIICPDGYNYDNSKKLCIKPGLLQDCTALNGNYDFELHACIAEPYCSNGGVFDYDKGICVKLTPSSYKGKNGYYFVFEDNGDNYSFYTPVGTPNKYQCILDQYVCPINNFTFNSKSKCDTLCYEYDATGNKVYKACNFVKKVKLNDYDDEDTCKYQCKTVENSYNGYKTLMIQNLTPFNKYSNVTIYKNGQLLDSTSSIINNNFYFGTDGKLVIPDIKSGDDIKIVISSKWNGTNYVTGLGYWDDKIGNKTIQTAYGQCFRLNDYFPIQNKISIGIDIDLDGYSESNANIPSFYCVSNKQFTKNIDIKVLDTGLKITYYDNNLTSQTVSSTLEFNNVGECVAKDSDKVEPIFVKSIGKDYIKNVNISSISAVYPANSYYGVKNYTDRSIIDNLKNHFCFYPLQEEYNLIANKNISLTSLFNLYKYYENCPSYMNNNNVKYLRLSSDNNKKETYELSAENISKQNLNLDIYSPLAIYNAINKKKIVTLPIEKGIYTSDNLFIRIPHIGDKKDLFIGYGYSPYTDCRSLKGTNIKTDIVYVDKDNCDYPGSWTYDSNIKKCVSTPTEDGCLYGYLVNNKCELEPKCPNGYINTSDGRCKKIIVTQYSTDEQICKPWWLIRRKYVCDGLNSTLDGYIFGLPRWITIKKVPVYKYQEYNFSK